MNPRHGASIHVTADFTPIEVAAIVEMYSDTLAQTKHLN
jgi:hypothetical protein